MGTRVPVAQAEGLVLHANDRPAVDPEALVAADELVHHVAREQGLRALRRLEIAVGGMHEHLVQRALEIQHRVEPDALIAAAAPERERFLGRERAQRLAQRDRQARRLVRLEHVIDVLGLICVHEIARRSSTGRSRGRRARDG